MDIRIQCMCVDAAEPRQSASFWEAALGWRRTFDEDDQVCIEPPKGSSEDGVAPDILFLKVPEPKLVKNRIHWEVTVQEVAQLVGALATLLREPDDDINWHVLVDPKEANSARSRRDDGKQVG